MSGYRRLQFLTVHGWRREFGRSQVGVREECAALFKTTDVTAREIDIGSIPPSLKENAGQSC